MVEKLIGDEVAGLYVPGHAGESHAEIAINAAKSIMQATGHDRTSGPWIPVGAGVHTGIAFVGSVVSEGIAEITALGDSVNMTARLASEASPGEVLVSEDARKAARISPKGMERRELELKGRSKSVQAWSLKFAG
jgi:adenylate cyclase